MSGADADEEEAFEMIVEAVLCCFQVVMDDAQREVAGLISLDGVLMADQDTLQQVAFEAATTMTSDQYAEWPAWLRQHFQVSVDGHVEMKFNLSIFEKWMEDNLDEDLEDDVTDSSDDDIDPQNGEADNGSSSSSEEESVDD